MNGLGPNWNPVPPPELPADAPVALFAEPVEISLGVARGEELDAAIVHGIHRRLGQVVHLHEPLVRQVRLDGRLAAVAVGQVDVAIFPALEQAELGHGS